MFSIPKITSTSKYNFILLVLATFVVPWQCASANVVLPGRDGQHLNPNARCPGKNVIYNWPACQHGGFIAENPNPRNCSDRYVCYKGLNDKCSVGDKCAYNAICTMCGICQKCDSAENCSEFQLCPEPFGFRTINNIKRFLEDRTNKMSKF